MCNHDMVVAGAGTSAANGTYLLRTDVGNGKLTYWTEDEAYFIVWNGADRWYIADVDTETSLYESLEDVSTPDQCVTWVKTEAASLPVPTVTADSEGGGGGLLVHSGMAGGMNG